MLHGTFTEINIVITREAIKKIIKRNEWNKESNSRCKSNREGNLICIYS